MLKLIFGVLLTVVVACESKPAPDLLSLILNTLTGVTGSQCGCSSTTKSPCGANEEFVIDRFRCQNTCEFYGRTFDCPAYDAPEGDCYCKKGFARKSEGGPCISIRDRACKAVLPPTEDSCGLNEHFLTLRSDFACENTCDNVGVPCGIVDGEDFSWSPRCECDAGFARLPETGDCVDIKSARCAKHYEPSQAYCQKLGELYSDYGSECQKTCANYAEYNMCWDDNYVPSKKQNSLSKKPKKGCYCPKGTTRFADGEKCINTDFCAFMN